jgi:hypothetical protein
MEDRLQTVRATRAALTVEAAGPALYDAIAVLARVDEVDEAARKRIEVACAILKEEANRFLADVKMTLREGVRLFEELGRDTIRHGAELLLFACQRAPNHLSRYYAAVLLRLTEAGWEPSLSADMPIPPSSRSPATQRLLVCSRFWFVEEQCRDRIVVMRRSPVPFDSLEVLIHENDAVLSKMRPEHKDWGLIVDMRQAPSRNDPGFEGAMRTFRETVTEGFARLAVLLESTAGVLQVNRLGRGEGQGAFATMSEAAAVKFARGET